MATERKLTRRDFLRLAGLATGAIALAACTPQPAAAPQQPTPQANQAPKATEAPAQPTAAAAGAGATTVKLLTTHGATMQPFIEKSLANFAAAHPEVKVDHEDLTEGYYDRLNVMVASNTLPDVVNLRTFDMYDWHRLGSLHEVSSFLDLEPTLKATDMIKPIMDTCFFDGKYWGMPYDASIVITFYNRDMFKAAGIAEPVDTWTQDDMLKAAQALTKGDNFGFAALPPYKGWLAEPFYKGNGASFVNEARDQWTLVGPEAEATLQWFIDLREKYKVAPQPSGQNDINLFVVGKGGMSSDGQWSIPGYRDALKYDWDVTTLPSGSAQHGTITHGGTYIMNAKTKVAEAAWKMQRWITAEKDWQMNVYGASGYSIPALKAVDEEAWMGPINAGKPPKRAHMVLDDLAKASPGALWPNYWKIDAIFTEELDKVVVTKDQDVKTGLANLKKRADQVIQDTLKHT